MVPRRPGPGNPAKGRVVPVEFELDQIRVGVRRQAVAGGRVAGRFNKPDRIFGFRFRPGATCWAGARMLRAQDAQEQPSWPSPT
jgi:hypothetical protein